MHLASPLEPHAEPSLEEIPGYRRFEPIGRGGSATVYRAEQEGNGFLRPVALKVIDRFADASRLRRFEAEKRILAALEHPGIARLYEAGFTSAGRPYLAMELVQGADLLEHCRRSGKSERERIALFLLVLEAVEHAHRASIVHRDLKPANILVSEQGAPKLLDFGIARLLSTEATATGETDAPGPDPTVTQLAPWTPAYASPEQIAGARADRASDLYSLGVVLYELLTGRRPYRLADRRLVTLEAAVRDQAPEPSGLGRDLDAILGKALEKAPADRYPSAADFAADLRRHLDGQPISARQPSRFDRWRRRIARRRGTWLAATLSALLVAGLAARFAGLGAHPGPTQRGATHPDQHAPTASPFLALPVAPAARADFRAGLDALARLETKAAIARLRKAAAADPSQPLIHAALATAHARAGHDFLARGEGSRALELAPAEPRESRLLAEATAFQTSGEKEKEIEGRRALWVLAPANFEAGFLLAKSLNESGGSEEAMTVIGRLRASPAATRPLDDLRLGLLEGEALNQLGRPAESDGVSEKVAANATARGLPVLAATGLFNRAMSHDSLGAPAEAQELAAQAERMFLAHGEIWGAVRAANVQCGAAIHDGRPLDAERACHRAIRTAERIGSATFTARGFMNLAISQRLRGNVLEARNTLARALDIERHGPLKDRITLGRYLFNLASLDSDLGRLLEGEEEFRQAIELLREGGNKFHLMRNLSALGQILIYRGALEQAATALAEAHLLAESVGSDAERGQILWRQADVAKLEGDLPRARHLFDQAAVAFANVDTQDLVGPFRVSRLQLEEPSERACRALEASSPELARTGVEALNELAVAISRCWSDAGFPNRARRWLDRSGTEAANSEIPAIRVDYLLARASVALGAKLWGEADQDLRTAEETCRRSSLGAQLFESRLLSARLAVARGDHPERVRTLAEELRRDAAAARFGAIAREAGALLEARRRGRR